MPTPHGIPLNEETLSAMPKEERQFWENFLREALEVIELRQEEGKSESFEPTDSLRAKYKQAIEIYDGEKYCQMWLLKHAFDWSEKVEEVIILN